MDSKTINKKFEKIKDNKGKVSKLHDKVSKYYQKMKSKETMERINGNIEKADKILDKSRGILDTLLKIRRHKENMSEERIMDILEKIKIFLPETTMTTDVEQNKAQGSVTVIGGECPGGMKYDKVKKVCVPKDEVKEEQEEKKCEDGYQWCPTQKKCVPVGSGDGDGPRKYQFHRYTNGRKRRKPRT